MPRLVPVFFDFACPYSYAAHQRDKRLARELGVRFAYLPWELSAGTPPEGKPNPFAGRNAKLDAFARACGARVRPRDVVHDTRLALRGVPYARALGAEAAFVDRAFEAYWDEGANLRDEEALRRVARESGLEEDAFMRAVLDEAMDAHLLAVDGWGEALGVRTTVTYVLGGKARPMLGSVDEFRDALRDASLTHPSRVRAPGRRT